MEKRRTDELILFNFMIWLLVISNFNQRVVKSKFVKNMYLAKMNKISKI